VSRVAPVLEAFFSDRLARQRHASPHTVTAYRDAFRLLLVFAEQRTGTPPCRLEFSELDANLVASFLTYLEQERGNGVATRNARLAAIRSFFRYASYREPAHAESIGRVLAIPEKRVSRRVVTFLGAAEAEALLAAPDVGTWTGRRDRALLVTMLQTGVRVAEVRHLRCLDVVLGTGAHVHVVGKGRKERCTPLSRHTVATLRAWLDERGGGPDDPVFPTRVGAMLSHDAVGHLVGKHAEVAGRACPSLPGTHVTPHTLRHTCAMRLLAAGVDIAVIALWLGHENIQTTQVYLHGDLTMKERALALVASPTTEPGRYHPPDELLGFLEQL
jgi:integrase/recombinase XerD